MGIKLPYTPEMAAHFDALFQWLHRRYNLEMVEVKIAETSFKLYKIADVDRLLNKVLEEESQVEDDIPYWAELWPSAIALSQFIYRKGLFEGKIILELGCGLGLVSMVAHLKGAQVILSDFQEDALRIAELNWLLNFEKPPDLMLLDWRVPRISETFEFVLASDVVYERRMFWPLIGTFQKVLRPAGRIYLSEPNRTMAQDFFRILKEEGFSWEKSSETVQFGGKDLKVSIYQICRKPTA